MTALTCDGRSRKLPLGHIWGATFGWSATIWFGVVLASILPIDGVLLAEDARQLKSVPTGSTGDSASTKLPTSRNKSAPPAERKLLSGKQSSSKSQTDKAGWSKASSRWTAAMQASERSRIDFINGRRPDQDEATEAAETPSNATEPELAAPADPAVLQAQQSLAEQFRKALEKRRLDRSEPGLESDEAPVSTPAKSDTASPSQPSAADLSWMSPSTARDLESEDPIKRENAKRFVRLRLQLLELKSKLQTAESIPEEPLQEPQASEPAANASTAATGDATEDQHSTDTLKSPEASDHGAEDHSSHKQTPEEHGANHPKPDEPSFPHSSDHSTPGNSEHAAIADNHADDSHSIDPHAPARHSTDPHDAHASDSHSTDGHSSEVSASENKDHIVRPLSQTPVVNGAIDRLGLANNLYAIGDYLVAREMYEQVDKAELTAQQQIWAEYQIANCLRRMGQKAEASNRYRRIAGQPEAGWLSEQSAWWVDVLERTRLLEKALQEDGSPPSKTASRSKEPQNGKRSR